MENEQQHNIENKLNSETSPYLLQHASNPVYWYPWGIEAIEKARAQDKPILLSVGYSACHWCHVMMRESFCDQNIAATMNRLFINIKIDKEERPDLDKAYQTAYQLLMGQPGGWPLTLFLSPTTLLPYYGGTYFPKEVEEGTIGFVELLHKLNEVYYHDKERIHQQELHITAILQIMMQFRPTSIAPIAEDLIHKAETTLASEFDPIHGGFGNSTKFPNCPCVSFVLNSHDTMTKHIGISTLTNMAQGGIYDHIAGGFFRYTVDADWQIPHFEKMLYDNGQLLGIYAKAYEITHKELFKDVALETGNWLIQNLLDPKTNAFFTAYDADTNEKEGLYYLWDLDSIKHLLSEHEFASIKKYFHLNRKANFDDKWHLYVDPTVTQPSADMLSTIKNKLLNLRNTRPTPELDNLILTGWNGLTIKGLCISSKILQNEYFALVAKNTIEFIKNNLYRGNKLYATWQNNEPKIEGFLDDYAFALDGILEYVDTFAANEYLPFCQELADGLIKNFYDEENGGFFFTANDSEKLFFRPKTYTDDSIPSGNGIACLALIKLAKLTDNKQYLIATKKTVDAALAFLHEAPELHLSMCLAYSEIQT